ncbi:hypothetical protein Tco_0322262 [Tanacetum coccineum]
MLHLILGGVTDWLSSSKVIENQILVHRSRDGSHHYPEGPICLHNGAYQVPPSPDYIPGLEVPPSPDYIPGPEVPPSPDYIPGPEVPPSPDYIPGPEEPQSPPPLDFIHRIVPVSDLEDGAGERRTYEDPEEDPADYPTDRDDDDDQRVRFASPTSSHEVGESSAAGAARQDKPAIEKDDPYSIARDDLYGFVDMVDVPPRCSTSRELDYDITDTWDDLETTNMYGIMEDAQDDRSQLRGRVNLLYRDRPVHRRLAVMIEKEAKMAREAWGLSMDASDYARSDVMSLCTTVVAQSALISELQSADHRRQRVISELLASDHKRQVQLTKTLRLLKGLQTQMVEFQRQHGPAKGPAQGPEQHDATGRWLKLLQREGPRRLNPGATPTPVTDTHLPYICHNVQQYRAMIDERRYCCTGSTCCNSNGVDSILQERCKKAVQVAL